MESQSIFHWTDFLKDRLSTTMVTEVWWSNWEELSPLDHLKAQSASIVFRVSYPHVYLLLSDLVKY